MKKDFRQIPAYLIGIIFIVFASYLIFNEVYGWGVMLLTLLIVLLKHDSLSDLVFSLKDGFQAKFSSSREKVLIDLEENKQLPTPSNLVRFSRIEAEVLERLEQQYGGEMKAQIRYVYGEPDKPEFCYIADGSMSTHEALYLFEIKYVLKPELADEIIKRNVAKLESVYKALAPSAGKTLVIKLVLASSFEIDTSRYSVPTGIELESIIV